MLCSCQNRSIDDCLDRLFRCDVQIITDDSDNERCEWDWFIASVRKKLRLRRWSRFFSTFFLNYSSQGSILEPQVIISSKCGRKKVVTLVVQRNKLGHLAVQLLEMINSNINLIISVLKRTCLLLTSFSILQNRRTSVLQIKNISKILSDSVAKTFFSSSCFCESFIAIIFS